MTQQVKSIPTSMQISGNAFADTSASDATRTIFSICVSIDQGWGGECYEEPGRGNVSSRPHLEQSIKGEGNKAFIACGDEHARP